MKTYKQIISEVAEPLGGDEKRFKAKHVIQKINLDAAEDGQFTGGTSAKKDKSKKASYKEGEDEAVYEETDKEDDMCPECGESYDECECDGEEMEEAKMSDADMKQRENIVKGMKKSKADLQARYGDKWKSVMYATATKKAMEESVVVEDEMISEAFKAGAMKLADGTAAKLTNEEASALNTLFKELTSANQKKMQERMMKDKKGFSEIVSFAKEAL